MITLGEWLQSWPTIGRHYIDGRLQPYTAVPDGLHVYVVADASHGARIQAFDLSDYRVTSVAGGSIWFTPKALDAV